MLLAFDVTTYFHRQAKRSLQQSHRIESINQSINPNVNLNGLRLFAKF